MEASAVDDITSTRASWLVMPGLLLEWLRTHPEELLARYRCLIWNMHAQHASHPSVNLQHCPRSPRNPLESLPDNPRLQNHHPLALGGGR